MEGKTINGFTLQRLLGVGGMAEVWLGENKIGKKAAVKLLLPKLCQDENVVSRFLTEAKVMVELNHPNIRQVYDYGEIDGRPTIVMEYLEGDDLKARMKRGQRFTDEELKRWWNQLVDALNYTHKKGIVHRDIKPGNIFVDSDGNIKLLDFGIAKVRESISSTQTGQKLGTLMYMSPEQVKDSKHIDYRTDVYSLAVTFVHLITGKKPYDSNTTSDFEISERIVYQPLDLSGLPYSWSKFLEPYLAKTPEQRPALRVFEEPISKPLVNTDESDDEGTIVGDVPKKPDPKKPEQKKTDNNVNEQPTPKTNKDKPKSKKGLWIGLVVVAVAAIVAVLLLKPNPDTQAFKACQTASDYRAYCSNYGFQAIHYAEAQHLIDSLVADSIRRAETEAFRLCTTIEGCDAYLEQYPQGSHVKEVQAKREELDPKTGRYNGHEWVDLGLPSGTLWATCNVGASKPEDYGDYYAWGETKTKSIYNWKTYKYANGYEFTLTKYCDDYREGNNGFTDNLTTLQPGDDAATANWGNGWRVPSNNQWIELRSKTTNKWTTQNGVKGRLFTAENGQSIFLPAAGSKYSYDKVTLDPVGGYGCYMSRSVKAGLPGLAWRFQFDSGKTNFYGEDRVVGFSVRPVREK